MIEVGHCLTYCKTCLYTDICNRRWSVKRETKISSVCINGLLAQVYDTIKDAMAKMERSGNNNGNEEEEEELMFRVNFMPDDVIKVFQRDYQTMGHVQVVSLTTLSCRVSKKRCFTSDP